MSIIRASVERFFVNQAVMALIVGLVLLDAVCRFAIYCTCQVMLKQFVG